MKIRNISDDSNSLELICVDLWGDLLPTSLAKYLTQFSFNVRLNEFQITSEKMTVLEKWLKQIDSPVLHLYINTVYSMYVPPSLHLERLVRRSNHDYIGFTSVYGS